MKEIEALYRRLLRVEADSVRLDPKVRAQIYKMIMADLERLQEEQKAHPVWARAYWRLDREIRRRLLKEIQIIIDDYTIARQTGRLQEWEQMYGDIEYYKEGFYRFRMDPGYERRQEEYTQGLKIVKGEWERVEYTRLP